METKTEYISNVKAALLQQSHNKFNCEVIEFGLAGSDMIRVTVQGNLEDIEKLFEYLDNPKDENQEAGTL